MAAKHDVKSGDSLRTKGRRVKLFIAHYFLAVANAAFVLHVMYISFDPDATPKYGSDLQYLCVAGIALFSPYSFNQFFYHLISSNIFVFFIIQALYSYLVAYTVDKLLFASRGYGGSV